MTKTAGFSLIEVMLVLTIIVILTTMAAPGFMAYRNRSRVAQVIESSAAIRSALASYAASSAGNVYPPTTAITDFSSLRLVVNEHGGMLPEIASFTVTHYDFFDSDGDGVADTYSMRLSINGMPSSLIGAQILLTPEGVSKCTLSGEPC